VPNKEVESFPIVGTASGRTILDSIPLFVPGISPTFFVGGKGEGLTVNGARPLANSFNVDGGDNNDYELNQAASPLPNPDALQELTIQTNNYKADVGGAAGAVIDAIVKQGTDRLHGNARYFVVPASLRARDFFGFAPPGGPTNAFGGQVGGPVLIPHLYDGRKLTHFFFDLDDSYDSQQYRSEQSTLSAAERSGDFSSLPPFDPRFPGAVHQPLDPLTRLPFPGGRIPPSRFDPIATYYLNNVFPLPSQVPDGYLANIAVARWNKQYTARIDQVLSYKDSVSALLFFNRYDFLETQSGGRQLQRDDLLTHSRNLVFHETHSFSAAAVNLLTASFSSLAEGDSVDAPGLVGVPPSSAGFTGIHPQNPALASLPQIVILPGSTGRSLFAAGALPSSQAARRNAAVKDDLILSRSVHTLKIGIGLRIFALDVLDPRMNGGAPNGFFQFQDSNPNGTGAAIADFLLGIPVSYKQSAALTQHPRQNSYFFYGMDDWRVRPNLTMSLGLRYELTPPFVDKLSEVMAFRPGAHSVKLPNAPAGMLFAGDPDPVLGKVPDGGYPATLTQLAPRIGVAYSPRPAGRLLRLLLGDGKSVARAGFGTFFIPTYGSDSLKPSFLPPFSQLVSLDSSSNPGFANPFRSQPNPFPIDPHHLFFGYSSVINAFDPRFRTAYSYHYNLSLQREVRSVLFELSYVGSNSFRLDREFNDNPVTQVPGLPYAIRRYPNLSDILVQRSDGRSRYDSFQARLSRKFGTRLMLDCSYVLSKGLDDSSGPNFYTKINGTLTNDIAGLSDPFSWARSEFDRRHNLVAFYAYDLPAPGNTGLLGAVLKGWQIGGITQLRSGMPIDISAFSANLRPDITGPFQRLDPRLVHTFVFDGYSVTGNFLFNPTVFRQPPAHNVITPRPGNLGRNVFDGPGINSTSLSIVKHTYIRESQQIEIRADVANAFNHAVFDPYFVGSSVGSYDFGLVSAALPGRSIQISVKYKF
jgi:hypothetical protein